jgi:hypothetical protein
VVLEEVMILKPQLEPHKHLIIRVNSCKLVLE